MTNEPEDEGNPSSQDAKQTDARRPTKARFMDVNSVLSVMGNTVKECTTSEPPRQETPESGGREQSDTCMIKVPEVPLKIDIKPGKGNSAQVQPLFKDPTPTADLGKDFDPFRDMPNAPWNQPATGSGSAPSPNANSNQPQNLGQAEVEQMYNDAMSQSCDMQIDTGVINISSFPKPLKLTARITNADSPQRVEVPRRSDSKNRMDSLAPEEKRDAEPSKIHQPVSGFLAKLVRKPPQAKVQQEEAVRAIQPEEPSEPKPVFQKIYTNSIKDTAPQIKHDTGLVDITRIAAIPQGERLEPPPPEQQSQSAALSTADQLPPVPAPNMFAALLGETSMPAKPAESAIAPPPSPASAPDRSVDPLPHFDTGLMDVSAITSDLRQPKTEAGAPHPIPARQAPEWFENQAETGRVDIRQIRNLSLEQQILKPAARIEKKVVPLMQTQEIIVSMRPVPQSLLHVTTSGQLDDDILFVGMQHCIQVCSTRRPRVPQPDNTYAAGSSARPGFLQGMMKKLGLE